MTDHTATETDTRERDLFLAALEKSDPAERAAFLDNACGKNSALRARLDDLLSSEKEAQTFLEQPALSEPAGQVPGRAGTGPTGTAVLATVIEQPGDRIGRYKLLQKIGEGGCGAV